jgi:hypothetical protein
MCANAARVIESCAAVGKKKKKASAAPAADEPTFPDGPAFGIVPQNTAAALACLRLVAVDYFVTADQVDLLVELFDEIAHKVRNHST